MKGSEGIVFVLKDQRKIVVRGLKEADQIFEYMLTLMHDESNEK